MPPPANDGSDRGRRELPLPNGQQLQPSWILRDPSTFATIHIKLPPHSRIYCESDAVVSFSQGITVRSEMRGGILGALGRFFLTTSSFFQTVVENTCDSKVMDVMLACGAPGGVALHRLSSSLDGDGVENGDLFVTSGSYIASDANVRTTSELQTKLGHPLLSGTGLFVLRATGQGIVACGAFGSVHRFTLQPDEIRAVDNGHLVAWSSSLRCWVGLAATHGVRNRGRDAAEPIMGVGTNVWNSITSGEGVMCYFEGPGTLYVQSHKAPHGIKGSPNFPSAYSGRGRSVSRTCICLLALISWVTFISLAGITVSILSVHGDEILDAVNKAIADVERLNAARDVGRDQREQRNDRRRNGDHDASYSSHRRRNRRAEESDDRQQWAEEF